jgi:hypothetical protein
LCCFSPPHPFLPLIRLLLLLLFSDLTRSIVSSGSERAPEDQPFGYKVVLCDHCFAECTSSTIPHDFSFVKRTQHLARATCFESRRGHIVCTVSF